MQQHINGVLVHGLAFLHAEQGETDERGQTTQIGGWRF